VSLEFEFGFCFVSVLMNWSLRFITSGKRTQVLPHMPLDRRKFVHDVRYYFPISSTPQLPTATFFLTFFLTTLLF
jgi:hypothetical protein